MSRAWDDAHDPGVDMIVELETADLRAELEAEREARQRAEIERDFARGILVDAAAHVMQEQPQRHLRVV